MKVVVCVSLDSRLIPSPRLQTPKRWRALSALRADPIHVSLSWAQQAGLSFSVRLGSVKTLMSFDPQLWHLAAHQSALLTHSPRHPTLLTPLRDDEVEGLLEASSESEVVQAMTRCAAVHAAEHLEGLSITGPLHARWGELCVWASHIALLNIDLKRTSTVHKSHRHSLAYLEKRWSTFDPIHICVAPPSRVAKATLSNLEHLPHLGALGSALGARVSLTAQLYFSISALGQWFWLWVSQSPELLTAIQTELSVTLKDTAYHVKLWRALPSLSSTVLELCRLYPPEWCISTPLSADRLLSELSALPELGSLLSARRPPSRLLLLPYWRHHDEVIFEEAARFNPRRHLSYILSDPQEPKVFALRPFGFSHPLESAKGRLIFHSLMALLTGMLRRGVYRLDDEQARALTQAPPTLCGGAPSPSGEVGCRFETAEHVAYIRSSRV